QRKTKIYKFPGRMTNLARGEAAGFRERFFEFIGRSARCSGNTPPQELDGPVSRAARDDDFESLEAGPTWTPSAASPVNTPAGDLEELKKYLPEGSVYLWAATIDGSTATDTIAGWIILM
ncbi:unnamed protein product, partial [Ascophyllum nodosum]